MTHETIVSRIAKARKLGDKTVHYIYKPAEWWRELYWRSPTQYYKQRYQQSIGVFCTACQNEGEPYQCAGWDDEDLDGVDESNRQQWRCPACVAANRYSESEL